MHNDYKTSLFFVHVRIQFEDENFIFSVLVQVFTSQGEETDGEGKNELNAKKSALLSFLSLRLKRQLKKRARCDDKRS